MFSKRTEMQRPSESINSIEIKAGGIFIWTVWISLALPQYAFGYIDPGSGSYFLQILLAAMFGALYAVKVFWTKIKYLFRRLLPWKKGPNDANGA